MRALEHLFKRNQRWAERVRAENPNFFRILSKQQNPKYLWIGCSDSRVPANQIVDLMPGEVFVHRNVANMVVHTDFNCLSAVHFAVDILKVEHVIVCGHYCCGGVQAALDNMEVGLAANWIRHIRDVIDRHDDYLADIGDPEEKLRALCRLNVIEQVRNLSQSSIIRSAWARRPLTLHGWIYAVEDGLLRDLDVCMVNPDEAEAIYRRAIDKTLEGDGEEAAGGV